MTTTTEASVPTSAPASWTKVLSEQGASLTWASSTDWDLVRRGGPDLLLRYHQAVKRYFHLKIRDPNVADELYSNFALKLIETDKVIRHAHPASGRFRHYLKKVLQNMVFDHYRAQQGRKGDLQAGPLPEAVADPREFTASDPDFEPVFHEVLLEETWKALEENDRQSGQCYYPVLRCKWERPELSAAQMAEELRRQCGKPFNPASIRQALHRAREKFAQLLLEEVEKSLGKPTLEQLEDELIELKLLPYCKEVLEQRPGRRFRVSSVGRAARSKHG